MSKELPTTLFGKPIVYSDKVPVWDTGCGIVLGIFARCLICDWSIAVASNGIIKCLHCGSIMPTPQRMEQTAEDADHDNSEWINSR